MDKLDKIIQESINKFIVNEGFVDIQNYFFNNSNERKPMEHKSLYLCQGVDYTTYDFAEDPKIYNGWMTHGTPANRLEDIIRNGLKGSSLDDRFRSMRGDNECNDNYICFYSLEEQFNHKHGNEYASPYSKTLLWYGNGVEAFHPIDNDRQVIVDGNDVTWAIIIECEREDKYDYATGKRTDRLGWYVKDTDTGQVIHNTYDDSFQAYQQLIEWVIQNYENYNLITKIG